MVADLEFDPTARHPIPVVFVHGLLGDRTNFLPMRTYLASVGVRSFATFSYGPRIDHHRLADELGRAIDGIRDATGARQVDLVGHSLGGLVARYVTESSRQRAVRRLVTLGAPYYTDAYPEQELAIFGDQDFLVRPPDRDGIRVIPDAGHLALLYHPAVLRAVAAYLLRPRVISPRLRSYRLEPHTGARDLVEAQPDVRHVRLADGTTRGVGGLPSGREPLCCCLPSHPIRPS